MNTIARRLAVPGCVRIHETTSWSSSVTKNIRSASFRCAIERIETRAFPSDVITNRCTSSASPSVQALKPGATCVLLDTRGCLCEGLGSNIFVVRNGEVLTPFERFVLAGLSRETVFAIAREEGVMLREADVDLYDAYAADEAFITSTSWCLVPVKSINGKEMGEGAWGPVTRRLAEGYKRRLGGFDYVAQYTRHNA